MPPLDAPSPLRLDQSELALIGFRSSLIAHGSPGLRGAHTLDCAFFDEDLVIRAVGDTIVLAPVLIASEEHRRHRGQACRHSAALALNQPTWPKVASLLSLEARGTGLLLLYSGLSPMFFMRARGQVAQR